MKIRKNKSPEMSGKRTATSDINRDNWDKEDEPEEKGVFKVASSEELQHRVIKKAKRKLTGDGSGSEGAKAVFSGFTGFTKTASNATTVSAAGSPFSFLSKITPSGTQSSTDKEKAKEDEQEKKSSNNFHFEKANIYYPKLKGLNLAVSNWIKKHVDENPLCILTPIFQDYEKYLKQIEHDKEQANTKSLTSQFTFGSSASSNGSDKTFPVDEKIKTTDSNTKSSATTEQIKQESLTKASSANATSSAPLFSFLKSDSNKASSTTTPTFSFGKKSESSAVTSTSSPINFGKSAGDKPITSATLTTTASTSILSFKPATTVATSTTGFRFSGSKPFTFGSSVTKPEGSNDTPKEDEEADEDQPPKVEFKPVVEEDSVYSKKCKVFVKQDKNYVDRGIGTLYLKPVKDSGKTQLLVRADTNLGNILINIILNESIPAQKMGKNNLMMVCIPTPEGEQKPTPILLRVKSGEEADELLETINKYKK